MMKTGRTPRLRKTGAAIAALLTAAVAGSTLTAETTSAAYYDEAASSIATTTTLATYKPAATALTATSAAVSNGFVWVWGYKGYGMSGNGVATDADTSPKPVDGLTGVTKVVGASDTGETYGTFAAMTDTGELYTWGSNSNGRLGIGSVAGQYDYRSTPQRVEVGAGETVIDIGAMRGAMVALTENGRVYTWGAGRQGQLGNSGSTSDVKPSPQLILGAVHSIHVGKGLSWVVMQNGRVAWWGRSTAGEYGGGEGGTRVSTRVEFVPPLDKYASGCGGPAVTAGDPADTCGIRRIAATYNATAMVLGDGAVYTFGSSQKGQLGRTTTVGGALIPQQVPGLSSISSIAAGGSHFTAMSSGGGIWGWGDNASWQATANTRPNGSTGQGTTEATQPVKLPLGVITGVGGSLDTSYASRQDSLLIGWGSSANSEVAGAAGARVTFTGLELPGTKLTPLQ